MHIQHHVNWILCEVCITMSTETIKYTCSVYDNDMVQYTIIITSQTTETVIFSGTFTTDSSNIVTAMYNDTDLSTNIIVPLTGNNPTPNSYGFITNGYMYDLTGGFVTITVPYDNGYLPTWQQFDQYGIIISSIPLYDSDANQYIAYNITSIAFQDHTQTIHDPATTSIGSIVGFSSSANSVYLDTVAITITPIPISNICFPRDTLVRTNQGRIAIQDLQPGIHTIRDKPILAITRTIHTDTHVVCFEKDALGVNYPAERTVMSKNHKIKYMGAMMPAKWFLNKTNRVYTIPHTGEILYNVILKNHTVMRVNNMMVETLHPNNIIARLYLRTFRGDQRRKLIADLNTSLLDKNTKKYRQLVRSISKSKSNSK